MADNVAITPGVGVSVATDDCGAGGHAQIVKLAISTDGSATAIPANAADGLLVNLGTNNDVTVSGVSTAAKQDTIIGHVDGIEALLGTIDADTSALAGAVSGTEVQVDIVGALPAGTNAIGKLAANSGVDIGDVDVTSLTGGTIAHGSADSGNPIKIGSKVQAAAASVTVEAAGDRSDVVSDLDGALIVRPCRLADLISDTKTNTDGTAQAFTGSFAAAANLYNYITTLSAWNSSASTVTLLIQDGSGGSTIWSMILPAGGGSNLTFNPPLRQPTVNTALGFDASAAASTISVSVNGFKSKA